MCHPRHRAVITAARSRVRGDLPYLSTLSKESITMQRIILPWSQARTPGINAEVVTDEVPTTDPIIIVSHAAVGEVRAVMLPAI
jgi:hypothetical protein